MKNNTDEVAYFSKSIMDAGIMYPLGIKIISIVLDQLNGYKHNRTFYTPSELSSSTILSIQRLLNEYGFHIEFQGKKGDSCQYGIIPNWK